MILMQHNQTQTPVTLQLKFSPFPHLCLKKLVLPAFQYTPATQAHLACSHHPNVCTLSHKCNASSTFMYLGTVYSCIGVQRHTDLGTIYSCIGVQCGGCVKSIANDQSHRITPSWVSFSDDEQLVGDSAKNIFHSNLKNTVFDAKCLNGCKMDDLKLTRDMKH
ncbi:HSP70-domain-containing protein, partial [Rhizopogon salebrosus TDB-379]